MLQNTPNCTIDKKSGEYAPIPLNIVCAITHYLLFLYKNEYFSNFVLAKYSLKRTKLHHFYKIFGGVGGIPNPPSKRVALIATRKYPHFSKIFYTAPPPKNDILYCPGMATVSEGK